MPDVYWLTLPLLVALHVVMGAATAGIVLATGNISLKLAPKEEATAYLASSTVVNSLAAGSAPILGGFGADFFAGRSVEWTLRLTGPTRQITIETLSLQQWDFFFVGAFLVGLYALHRLALVREEGHIEEHEVLDELKAMTRRRLTGFSSIGGLRQMLTFPLGAVASSPERSTDEEESCMNGREQGSHR